MPTSIGVGRAGRTLGHAVGESTTDDQASRLIEQLGLIAHPEGGHYREFFRSTVAVSTPRGARCASTAIWFLLGAGEFSAFHQVLGDDEVWHHCGGDPLRLHSLDERGARTVRLGPI